MLRFAQRHLIELYKATQLVAEWMQSGCRQFKSTRRNSKELEEKREERAVYTAIELSHLLMLS